MTANEIDDKKMDSEQNGQVVSLGPTMTQRPYKMDSRHATHNTHPIKLTTTPAAIS